MLSGRSRIPVRAFAEAGQAEVIAINWEAPFNCTLLQATITYGGLPHQGDTFVFGQQSAVDARISPIFRQLFTGVNGWQTAGCNEYFELFKGDLLVVTAANGNDLDIGVEMILREGS